jgi:hypothetical protein
VVISGQTRDIEQSDNNSDKEVAMAIETRYLFTASMDVDPDKEDLFNEVYDTEHVPNLCKVPGLLSVTRLVNEPFTMAIGGELRSVEPGSEPRYSAIYEIESPDVIASPEWATAVEKGRWPTEVRPFTHNRHHRLQKVTKAAE